MSCAAAEVVRIPDQASMCMPVLELEVDRCLGNGLIVRLDQVACHRLGNSMLSCMQQESSLWHRCKSRLLRRDGNHW
jgi:hypothetical protein